MSDALAGLKPSLLWKYFSGILTVPHCSGSEGPIGDWILGVAKELGLPARKDGVGNVVVSKPASAGREKAPGVVLQGHLDMVCEKNSATAFDFCRDAIKARVDGGWVKATGTTLGADNGLGVAAALAVLEDKSLAHGPVEALFTVDEERGLTGANKVRKDFVKGTLLLNLDAEDEGIFTIGCAGGADASIDAAAPRAARAPKGTFALKVSGFRGGHSGVDIHRGRANAIKVLTRLLWEAAAVQRFELISVEGGSKHNAIPREATAVLACDPAAGRKLAAFFKKAFAAVRNEFKAVEPDAALSFAPAPAPAFKPMTAEARKALLELLMIVPHGVVAMNPEIEGLVETSNNVAIVRTDKAKVQVYCSSRSSTASALDAIREVLSAAAEACGAKITLMSGYPGWKPNLQSPLLAKLREVYRSTFGKDAEVNAIHAGLECGILGEKFPGLDMISVGPTVKNGHSPDEAADIVSVEKFWTFLVAALDALSR